MKLVDKLHEMTEKHTPLSSGFYAYHTPQGAVPQYRLHLRIEPDGEGVLIVNASSVLHLNQTATEMVFNLIQGKPDAENANLITKRFKVDAQTSLQDVALLHQQLDILLNTTDLDPEVQNMFEPHFNLDNISAPYRLDCYLNDNRGNYQPTLDLDEWKNIVLKAFNAGIPHLVFCGAEPTEVEWLPDLLAYAEELGLVTGLVSRGSKLADGDYLKLLTISGLDHLMVIYDPLDEIMRSALTTVLPMDLYTTVGLIVRKAEDSAQTISWLDNLGANAYSLIAYEESDIPAMHQLAEELVQSQHRLVSDMPFPLDFRVPSGQTQDQGGQTRYINLAVSPNGDVFADNSWDVPLGSLLQEDFESIWANRKTQV